MDLSQVLLKFESFRSGSITFFQVQEFLNSILELGPVENIKRAKGNECISFGLFNIFQFLSFIKSQLFYIHISWPCLQNIFHCSYSDSGPSKTFSPCCSSCVGANKMLGSGSQETDPEPRFYPPNWIPLQYGFTPKRPTQKPHPSFMQGLVWNKN
jgi:hypothetical protein